MDGILSTLGFLEPFGNIISVLVTAAVTWAGSFLFYRQRRESMDIENDAKQSEAWRNLYLESQEDSRKKDAKIDELRKEINDLRSHYINLEREVKLNSIYRCDNMQCPNRTCVAKSLEVVPHPHIGKPSDPESFEPES